MTTALVTGASGFVGAHLCALLCERGQTVRALVRSPARGELLRKWGVELVQGDITEPATLQSALPGCDVVYHVAGLTKATSESAFFAVNGVGTKNVATACAERQSPPLLVVISTLAVAGPAPAGQPHLETSAPYPVSMYGRSKLSCECEALKLRREMPITIVRPPMVCGERDRDVGRLFEMVRTWGVMAIPGFRDHQYSIIHARDLCEGIIAAAERGERADTEEVGRGIYYMACDEQPTLIELGRMMATAMEQKAPIALHVPPNALKAASAIVAGVARLRGKAAIFNPDKIREALAGNWICSNEKMKSHLGVTPAPLLDRLKQTAGWYMQEGWLRGA